MTFKYKELTGSIYPEARFRGDEPGGAQPWLAGAECDDPTEEKCTCGATCGADTGANCTDCTICTNAGTDCGATNCGATCTQCTQTAFDREERSGRAASFALLQEQLRQTLAQTI